jgi:hypothetical protein
MIPGAMPSAPVRVGFARADLSRHLPSGPGLRRALEAHACVVVAEDGPLLLVSLDLIGLSTGFCADLQSSVSVVLGMAPERVLIHTTHTHSAPWQQDVGHADVVGLDAPVIEAARGALDAARPARLRAGSADVGSRLSIHRRGEAGEDLGVQTFWFGYRFRPGDDRADASALATEMSCRWRNEPPRYEDGEVPVFFDRPVDPLVHAAHFEDEDGRPLGSLVRFSAHPHLTGACRDRLWDPDFPGRTRDVVEGALGGPCLFLLGPAANLVPKERVRYALGPESPPPSYFGPTSALVPVNDAELLDETDRIGREVGEAALAALEGRTPRPLARAVLRPRPCPVPLDPLLPTTADEIDRMQDVLREEHEAVLRAGGPLRELRALANRMSWLQWAGRKGLVVLSEVDRSRGEVVLPAWVLALEDQVLAFLHSEVAVETTLGLRAAHPSVDLWTVSLTGGTLEYLPTAEMLDEGGYEGRSALIRRDAEARLRGHLSALVAEVARV